MCKSSVARRTTVTVRLRTTIMDLAAFCLHKTSPCEILNTVRGHAEKVQDMTTRGNTRTVSSSAARLLSCHLYNLN
jgi:hypothetical protein